MNKPYSLKKIFALALAFQAELREAVLIMKLQMPQKNLL